MSQENTQYIVLARKYRPKKLSDLIGQQEIITILKGALSLKRLAQAYLLSGTRGVGKTTLARIISKVVNCSSEVNDSVGDPCGKCQNCLSIDKERNIDVIELDAASRTGVGDVREIIENINYKPVAAKKKIYIIDEVHMLSKAAFNALLKTLEEPPPDVVFLLATTETEKIPVTILSRCQHFELKRIDSKVLSKHLQKISLQEGVTLDIECADIISRSSDGSVRDALSILDNILTRGNVVTKAIVNDVLGLSDLTKVFTLFDSICEGNVSEALKNTDLLYLNGVSLERLARDLIDIVYYVARFKTELIESELSLSEYEISKFKDYSKNLDMDVVIRFWELMQRYFDEIIKAFDQKKCFELIVIRLCYISLLPTPFETLSKSTDTKNIQSEELNSTGETNFPEVKKKLSNENVQDNLAVKAEALTLEKKLTKDKDKISDHTKSMKLFEDLVKLVEKKGEFIIAHELINNFKLVSLKQPNNNNGTGLIELENLNKVKSKDNLLWKVSKILQAATDKRWLVSILSNGGIKTLKQVFDEREKDEIKKLSNDNQIKKLLEIIPDSEIVSFEKLHNNSKGKQV